MEWLQREIIKFADTYIGKEDDDYTINGRTGELVAKYCPFCHGGENGDKKTFAINMYTGAYNCKRGSCGVNGGFNKLRKAFGLKEVDAEEPQLIGMGNDNKKKYKLPSSANFVSLTERAIDYCAKRMISEETLLANHVCCNDKGNIVFPFYRNNELVYVKYRKPEKYVKSESGGLGKEWQEPNTEPILFGMDMCDFNKPLIITEGEMDALAMYEAGIRNVVSVPAGCNNMEWIKNCWEWLDNFQEIVLFGDSDEPGVEMMNSVMKRLGEYRCMIAPQYPELFIDGKDMNCPCKDANEILYTYGPDKLKELVSQCKPAPIKGILNLASVPFTDPSTLPRIYTRIPALDNAIGGLGEGQVTVFTGKRGEGKSTLNGQLLLNAIQQGHSVCAYSGELSAQKFLEWIFLQATESKYVTIRTDERSGRQYAYVPEEIQKRIRNWINEKFWLFDNAYIDDMKQEEAILKVFEICARRFGCKLFLCDNLMIALSSADEENRAQARFAAALKAFAVKYKVHVILVAHPRKTKPGESLTNDDVSGSSAITNLADTVISVEKPHIRITKNRENGITDYIECTYNPANRRIFQTMVGDRTVYGWDHNGIEVPEVQAETLPQYRIIESEPQPF